MSIVTKILNSFPTTEKVLYGDAFDFNTIVESVPIDDGGLVLIQELRQSQLLFETSQRSWIERADLLLFFLTLSTYDRDSIANEGLIDGCRRRLIRWLLQFPVRNNDLRPVGDIRLERVYEKSDTILTGLAVSLSVREDLGTNGCNVVDT